MDPSAQRLLIGILRVLYASLGFILSVLAALLTVLPRSRLQSPPPTLVHPRSKLPLAARGRKPTRVFSDQSPIRTSPPTTVLSPASPSGNPSSPTSTPSTASSSTNPNKRLRRARSIPTITVDFFGGPTDKLRTPAIRFALPDSAPATPIALSPIHSETEPEPLLLSDPEPSLTRTTKNESRGAIASPPRMASPPPPSIRSPSPKPSLLSQFKQTLTKDKDKTTSPRMPRVRSSPHISATASTSASVNIMPGVQVVTTISTALPPIPCPFSSPPKNKDSKEKDKHRAVRKAPSTPAIREGWGINNKTEHGSRTTLRKSTAPHHGNAYTSHGPHKSAEKKRSGTLRTDPYEAPYFCPPPTVSTTITGGDSLSTSPKSIPRRLSKPRIVVVPLIQ